MIFLVFWKIVQPYLWPAICFAVWFPILYRFVQAFRPRNRRGGSSIVRYLRDFNRKP